MKLIQLRYLVAVAENDLNITQAARVLHAAQPGVSKQLKQLEDELGFQLFERKGRALVRATHAGTKVIDRASQIVRQARSIKALAADLRRDDAGALSIATTHTQARYVLPPVLKKFREKYPKVRLHLHQGNSEQIADLAATDRIDFAIATGGDAIFGGLKRLPCYRWHRAIVVPHGHPLGELSKPGFEDLAKYPLVTYSFSFAGPSSLVELFAEEGLTPNVALTAWDSDVIKKYVREGLGVGILANLAIDGEEDADLKVRDASHLFPVHTTWVGFRRGVLLRGFMYDFLEMFAPHLTHRRVQDAESVTSPDEVEQLFAGVRIPFLR
jgi:LysR family transcriptional regulator, cys regulon transcriptional activator